MNANALLILTVGRTDVQLVAEGRRREFPKACARLHAELERRTGDWQVVTAPDLKSRDEVKTLPAGGFELCAPKLDAVLEFLEANGTHLTHALILETRRDPEAESGDPRAAGRVVHRRLSERLGEALSIVETCIAQGSERFEDLSNPRDAVICRNVVARIDQAVRQATAEIGEGRIIVATAGGLPRITAFVEEVVRLHAVVGTPIELLEVPDGAKAAPPTRDRAVVRQSVPEPAESYTARRHVLDLIEGGHLLGAWGAARHLKDDEVEKHWTRVVEWLAGFAASCPIPDCDIGVLRHEKMAVRAAIRVEFALRAGDIPRAVHGTVAFFEAALWDHLNTHKTREREGKGGRGLYQWNPVPQGKKLVRDRESPSDRDRRPFEVEEIEGEGWYRVFDDDVCAILIAKHYLKNDALTRLGQAVSTVRDLRNDVAHNEPSPERMAKARRRMAEAGLWSCEGRFLTQGIVRDVLVEFGETNPDRLCEDLIETVRTRLLAHQLG